jgi:hypothetical protein
MLIEEIVDNSVANAFIGVVVSGDDDIELNGKTPLILSCINIYLQNRSCKTVSSFLLQLLSIAPGKRGCKQCTL